jgi:membrane protein involved in colicin uptake
MDVFSEAEKAAINKSEEKAAKAEKAAQEAAAKNKKAAQEAAAKATKETSKSTSEKLKETTSWFNSMDWDIKAHTPSKKTGRDADLYDQHLSRNVEEFLKRFMK